jgi:hypothetical protein
VCCSIGFGFGWVFSICSAASTVVVAVIAVVLFL